MATPSLNMYLRACPKEKIHIIVSKFNQVEALRLYVQGNYQAYSLDGNMVELIKIYLKLIFASGPIAAPALSSKPLSLAILCLFGKRIYTNSRAAFSIPWLITRLEMNMYQKGMHQVNYYIKFLSILANIRTPRLSFIPAVFEKDCAVKNEIPLVVLGISSGYAERNKIPSASYFANFVNHLSLKGKFNFLLISTINDNDVTKEFLAKVQKDIRITDLRDLTLKELTNAVMHADLAISGTTGQGHIFATCNIPMLVFSGVTDFNQSGPFAKEVVSIGHNYPCGPCYDEKYRFGCGRKCMESIDTNEAVNKALMILNRL